MYKLSIITINYNNKKGLEKTIESVVNQSFRDIEYIVIDGDSNDGALDVIYKHKDKINYWISEKDSGIYNAMNKGIKAANGEFILFLNSGDFLISFDVIDKIILNLVSENSIYFGDLIYSKNEIPTILATFPDKLTFSFFLNYSLPHPASFIKKSLFDKYFYYNEEYKIVSDWEFFIYCICKMNEKYKHLNYVISNFDDSGMSSSEDNFNTIEIERVATLNKHFSLFMDDINYLKRFNDKYYLQFDQIKNTKFRWKILKGVMNIINYKKSKKLNINNNQYIKIDNLI